MGGLPNFLAGMACGLAVCVQNFLLEDFSEPLTFVFECKFYMFKNFYGSTVKSTCCSRRPR